jgi:ABC-type Fe3+-hydroxamate transport system substrate-binding protein
MRFSGILSLIILSVLIGCSGEEYPGKNDEQYYKIVSLGPAITHNIRLLGEEELICGVSSFCEAPEGTQAEIAGDIINPNIEQILKLSPDIVIATELARPEALDKLRSFGFKVMVFEEPKSFEDICSQFIKLGGVLGEAGKAEKIVADIKNKIEVLKKKSFSPAPRKVLIQIGSNPLWVSAKNSFMNDIIEYAGGINIGPEKGGMISAEEVLRQNPDVILIVDMGIGGEQKKMWEHYPVINAVKNDRLGVVDSYTFCSPTPDNFLKALEETAGILNG